jgi:hypothetical protein
MEAKMKFEGVLCFVPETAAKTFVPLYLISDGEKHFYTTDRSEFGRVPKRYLLLYLGKKMEKFYSVVQAIETEQRWIW